jgi:hypothetical protein
MIFDKLDALLLRFESWLNLFTILWTALAVGIIVLSNLMNRFGWHPMGSVLPFDIRDNFKVALLLAPSGVVAVLYLIRGSSLKAKKANKP